MERTRSAAVLTIIGALALVLLASPAGAEDREELVPFGRCDVYRPADEAIASGVDRCVTGMAPAGATVELPEPACPDVVSVPADGGTAFYVGGCPPEHAHDAAAAAADPAPAPEPTTTTTVAPPPPAPRAASHAAPTTTTTVATTSTTMFVSPPPPPVAEGGASTVRAATVEVVTDPAASAVLTSAARAANIESDHSPIVMLFALALLALAMLGVYRFRGEH